MNIPDVDELAALTIEELSGLMLLARGVKAELNRRNATSDLDRTNTKWREKAGVEPLPAYEGFAYALAWQKEKRHKQNKKLARAVPIMLLRPELFIHRMGDSGAVQQMLYFLRGWTADLIPEELRQWVGPRGRARAEQEIEVIDNKLRDLTQRPEQAPACLRPTLDALKKAYAET